MSPLLLCALAAALFLMAYRYYARFISLAVFVNARKMATREAQRDDHVSPGDGRVLFTLHRFAAGVGLLSLPGIGVALVWGWVPAFLWIVVGTVVAGGVAVAGAAWASLRKHGESLASVAYDLTGFGGALALYGFGVLLVAFAAAVVCTLIGQLLGAHPEASWAFLALLPLGAIAARGCRAHTLWWFALALILFSTAVVAGLEWPLSLAGQGLLRVGEEPMFVLHPDLLWSAVALAIAYRAAAMPDAAESRGRGAIVGVCLILTLTAVVVGLALLQPSVSAPPLQSAEHLPNPFALLFLALTSGALSGVHTLMNSGLGLPVHRQRAREPLAGYRLTLAVGLVAVLVLVVIAAGVGEDAWRVFYGGWPDQALTLAWLDLAVTKLGLMVAATGIAMPWAVGLVAAVFAAAGLVMLEQLFRLLAFAVDEFAEDFDVEMVKRPHFREWVAALPIAVAVLWLNHTQLGLSQWLLLGLANQWFACAVLFILCLAAIRLSRPSHFFVLPLALVVPLTLWGGATLLWQWWQERSYDLLALGLVFLLLAARVAIAGLWAYSALPRNQAAIPPGR